MATQQDAGREPLPATVRIRPVSDEARQLWDDALALAEELPEDGWVLVGGLMVQLHAERYGQSGQRATTDIDILTNSRERPSVTETVAQKLLDLGFDALFSSADEQTLFRFKLDGKTVDVLGPDGLKGDPPTVKPHTTLPIPGGTQALARSELVRVEVEGGRSGVIRVATLTAGILLKARSVQKKHREKDRQDLVVLLSCVEEPLEMKEEMTSKERGWLRKAAKRLRIEDDDLLDVVTADQLARARATYELLTD